MPKTITAKLNQYTSRLAARVEIALRNTGYELLSFSKPLVPVDTYALKNSGRVRKFGAGFQSMVTVGYGAKDIGPTRAYSPKEGKYVTRDPSEYAVIVHQDAFAFYEVGQFFYLSGALYKNFEHLKAYCYTQFF